MYRSRFLAKRAAGLRQSWPAVLPGSFRNLATKKKIPKINFIRICLQLKKPELFYFDPGGCGRIETRIEGDGVVDVRTECSSHVQHGHLHRADGCAPGRIQFAVDVQIRPLDVRVDEHGQIIRIDVVFEILAVDVHQIVIPLFAQLNTKIPEVRKRKKN